MSDPASPDAYEALLEPLWTALGRLVFAAGVLEKALLLDLLQRRLDRDGADEVFGRKLVSRFERLTAGALLEQLIELGYAPALAEKIAAAIGGRNRFVHHLFDEPDFISLFASPEDPGSLIGKVDSVVADIQVVTMELAPQLASDLQRHFGAPPSEILASLKAADLEDLDDDELREQIEALQGLPEHLFKDEGAISADPT